MLSKGERNFVTHPESFSKSQSKFYRYRINKKIQQVAVDLQLILQNQQQTRVNLQALSVIVDKKLISKVSGELQNVQTEKKDSLSGFEEW